MAAPADAVLALASGAPLVLLGLVLLALKPRRVPQAAFGLFAVLWGAQALAANVGRVLNDASLHRTALLASQGCMMASTIALLRFSTHRAAPAARIGTLALASSLGLAGATIILLRPEWMVESVVARGGTLATTYGPGALAFAHGPFFAALFVSILLLYRAYRAARDGTPRHRARGLLVALTLFVSYVVVRQLAAIVTSQSNVVAFASGSVGLTSSGGALAQEGLFLMGAICAIALAVDVVTRPVGRDGIDTPLLAALALPATTAILEAWLASYGIHLELLGFWRLLSVAVIVFTLARYQLFDLEARMRRLAAPGAAGLFMSLGVPLSLSLTAGEASLADIGPGMLLELIGIGGTVLFHRRIGEALFPKPIGVVDDAHQRKLEVYRVALEDAIGRGQSTDTPELRELRVRLNITDGEHTLLAWMSADRAAKPREAAGAGVDDVPAAAPGLVVLGRYRLVRLLGENARGRTFLAYDQSRRGQVVVKMVDHNALGGDAAKRLLRDARLAATLQDEHVVPIHDVAETPTAVVVVMEYADQGNVADVLRQLEAFPLDRAARTLDGVLSALELAHARGIVHRAVKEENVLIEEDGRALLADFGSAAEADASAPADAGEDLRQAARLFRRLLANPNDLPPPVASFLQVAEGGGFRTAREMRDALRAVAGGALSRRARRA